MNVKNTVSEVVLTHEANKIVLADLKCAAELVKSTDLYVLHTHPDLIERVETIASYDKTISIDYLYGVVVIANASGEIVLFARGTASLFMKASEKSPLDIIMLSMIEKTLYLEKFIKYDPWNINVPTNEWVRFLERELMNHMT